MNVFCRIARPRLGFSLRRYSTQSAPQAASSEVPPGEWSRFDVSWLKRDVLLFAASIGCRYPLENHFLYELHPKFAVFPTYPLILPFKRTSQEVTDYLASQAPTTVPGAPTLNPTRILDAQRRLEILKPLPTTSAGRHFEIASRVVAVYDKGKSGSSVETEQMLREKETGDEYAKSLSTKFFVGQGDWGGPRGPKAERFPPRDGEPDRVCEIPLTEESAHLYRLNGDYNPLHATPEPGEKLGLGGSIMHGLHTWNATAVAVLREYGGSEPKRLKLYQARFAAPVKPGSTLKVKMWKEMGTVSDTEEIRFVTMVGDTVVLDNGRAILKRK